MTHPMERAYDFHSQVGVCVVDLRGAADATANALEAPKARLLVPPSGETFALHERIS